MKTKLLGLIIMHSAILLSQNQDEIIRMTKDYNISEINKMMVQFEENGSIKNNKIELFIKKFPAVKRSFYRNGSKHVLFDIIDNKPIYITNDNQASAIATNTNSLYPGGELGLNLEGEGMTIGVWEIDHPLTSHTEFQDDQGNSRISTPDSASPEVDFHATHVTGTIGAKGQNQSAKGMAPKSTILAYNSSGDNNETTTAHLSTGMLVSNHSYGVYIFDQETNEQNVPDWYMGCYINDARSWDQVHYNSPGYLKVTSAGNSGARNYSNGLGSGLDKLTADKNSKNSLIVASAQVNFNPFSGEMNSLRISTFSSQGPTDDGRIKPDITGRGEQVYSTSNNSANSYGSSQGTSMSSPGVAGSLLLLQELYNDLNNNFMKSSTLRGLACHTATDDADFSDIIIGGLREGPDPYWGWGLLNSKLAAQTILDAQSNASIIEENSLSQGQSYSFTINVSDTDKLMASICWTDPAGPSQYGILNSTAAVLINDLDIRITDDDGNEYMPWKLDLNNLPSAVRGDNTVDNIERVEINSPSAENYTITVSHKGILGGPFIENSQDYSLIVTGSNLTLSDPSLNNDYFTTWPNPAKDVINFKLPTQTSQAYFVSLYDVQGRQVYKQTINPISSVTRGQIKTTSLARGVYVLKINQGNASMQQKVVLK